MKYIRTPDITSHFANQAVSVKSAFNQQETSILSRGIHLFFFYELELNTFP